MRSALIDLLHFLHQQRVAAGNSVEIPHFQYQKLRSSHGSDGGVAFFVF